MILSPGITSVIKKVFIQDSSVTTGDGKTALAYGDITAYYVRAGGVLTALTMETIATPGIWASTGDNYLGFIKLHDTNAPGIYELHLPNNILAAGANDVTIQLRAAGAAPCNIEIQLKDVSNVAAILGTALTETSAGYLAAAFKKLLDVATPVLTAASVNQTGDNFPRIGLAGAGLTAIGDTRIANLDAAVSTRSTLTAQQVWEYATRTLSSFGTLVADIWASGTRTLSSYGTLVADAAAAVWASVTRSLTDKAGFTISGTKTTLDALQDLSQAGAQAGAAAALTAYGTALEATLTAMKGGTWSTQTLVAISAMIDDLEGRLTAARAGYLDELAAANLPADIDTLTGRLTALRAGYLDSLSGGIPTVGAIADQVWDEAIAGHLDAGSTGNALNAAGAAGDPWSTPIPGAYGAGTAGKILGDNINAPIATVDTVVDAIKAKTDNLPAAPAIEGNVQGHVAAALAAYDPPTRAEATADKAEIEALTTKVLQILINRLVGVPATGVCTIYKDDAVTPLVSVTVSGTGRSTPTWL